MFDYFVGSDLKGLIYIYINVSMFPCMFCFVMFCMDVLYVYCMHIYVCICVYVYLHVCIYVCFMYMYICMCVYQGFIQVILMFV